MIGEEASLRVIRKLLAAAVLSLVISSTWAGSGCADEERRGIPRLPHTGSAEVIAAGVVDGDTFVAEVEGAPRRIRLARIDAPLGHRAEQALRDLVWKRTVQVRWHQVDRSCRPIAEVRVDGTDVSAALVRLGMAWQ